MSEHETIRDWLALSAAGLLDAAEERRVHEHAARCAECAADLEQYAALSSELRMLPAPQPPPDLAVRTAALVAMEADRRQGAYLAGVAAVLVFILVPALAQTLRLVLGEQLGDRIAFGWMVCAAVSSLFGAAAALVLSSPRGRFERRMI